MKLWPHMSALGQKQTSEGVLGNVRFTPKRRTLKLSRVMSALCQKQTCRLLSASGPG
jgi:hypothetical protein